MVAKGQQAGRKKCRKKLRRHQETFSGFCAQGPKSGAASGRRRRHRFPSNLLHRRCWHRRSGRLGLPSAAVMPKCSPLRDLPDADTAALHGLVVKFDLVGGASGPPTEKDYCIGGTPARSLHVSKAREEGEGLLQDEQTLLLRWADLSSLAVLVVDNVVSVDRLGKRDLAATKQKKPVKETPVLQRGGQEHGVVLAEASRKELVFALSA